MKCSRVQCYALLNTMPWRQGKQTQSLLNLNTRWSKASVSHPGEKDPNTHWIGVWLVSRDSMEDLRKKIISCACLEELKPVSFFIQHTEWDSWIAMSNTQPENWLNFKLSHHKQCMLVAAGTQLHPFLTWALHWGEWSASHSSHLETEFLNILLHAITVMDSIQ